MSEVISERWIGAPAQQLWELLEDPERRSLVDERVVSSQLLAPGPDGAVVGRRERYVARIAGMEGEVDTVVVEHDPPRAIAWRVEETRLHGRPQRSPRQEYGFRLEPDGAGTRVRMHYRLDPHGVSQRLGLRLTRKPWRAAIDDSLDRLERAVRGDSAPRTEPRTSPDAPSLAARVDLGTLSLGLTILTGFAYLVLRTVTDLFYAPLRLAPEDVGLGQPELLGRSLGLVLVSLFVTLTVLVLVSARAQRRLARWLAALPLIAIWGLIGFYVRSPVPLIVFVATGISQIAILVVGARKVIADTITVRRWISLQLLVTTLLGLLAYGSALASLAVQSRRDVEAGVGLSDAASVLLPWEATATDVAWKGRTPPPLEVPACGIYLGASGSTTLLYDPLGAVLVRVPSADVLLHLRTETSASCP